MKRTRIETRILWGAALAAAIAFGAAPAHAQKQTPPEGGPPKAFTVPAHESYTLPNGLKVTLVPYGIIPKVTVSVALDAGGVDEGGGRSGLSGLTGDFLKEGTTSLTSDQLSTETARMGSSLDINAGVDQTTVGLDVLAEFGPAAVRLLADVLEHPRFPETELGRLKNDLLRSIAVRNSRPQTIAAARFRKILYGDHPYGIVVPAEDDVKKLSEGDVRSYYQANFSARRAHLYVAGKFNTAEVKKAVAESFGKWAAGTARTETPPAPKPRKVLDVTDRPGAPQSTLVVGLPVLPPNSPDAVSFLVMNSLLGGSFNSRITANIREQKGYTYSPFSEYSRRYHDGYWAERADVTTQFTGASLKEIFAEITRLGNQAPAAQELKGIQNYMSGVFVIQNSSRGALITQLQYVDAQGLGDDYLRTFVARVNAVTPETVQGMCRRYLSPADMTIVVVGDKSKITEQLAAFAPPPGQ